MRSFADAQQARGAIADYPIANVPAFLRDRYRALRDTPSPVDQIAGLGEFIYANRAEFDDEALELAAGLIGFATFPNMWHGLSQDGRGDKIILALRRDLSEEAPPGVTYPDPKDDPAPQERHVIEKPVEDDGESKDA